MYQMMIDALHRRIFGRLRRWTKQMKEDFARIKTALTDGQNEAVYDRLAEMARHSKLLCMDLREALTAFHSDLQTTGFFPPLLPYPQAGEVGIALENGCISIKMAAMLPFPSNGSVFFLHDQLDRALRRFLMEHKLPTPIFTERCGKEFSRVCWCQNRILTLESLGENLLVRVDAVLPGCHAPQVERLMQESAMRESGYYRFSAREIGGFVLAQIMIYAVLESGKLMQELDAMYAKLDKTLRQI